MAKNLQIDMENGSIIMSKAFLFIHEKPDKWRQT